VHSQNPWGAASCSARVRLGQPETPKLWIVGTSTGWGGHCGARRVTDVGQPDLERREQLEDWVRALRAATEDLANDSIGCSVGLDTLIINPNGDVHNCDRGAALATSEETRFAGFGTPGKAQRGQTLACAQGCTENARLHRPIPNAFAARIIC